MRKGKKLLSTADVYAVITTGIEAVFFMFVGDVHIDLTAIIGIIGIWICVFAIVAYLGDSIMRKIRKLKKRYLKVKMGGHAAT